MNARVWPASHRISLLQPMYRSLDSKSVYDDIVPLSDAVLPWLGRLGNKLWYKVRLKDFERNIELSKYFATLKPRLTFSSDYIDKLTEISADDAYYKDLFQQIEEYIKWANKIKWAKNTKPEVVKWPEELSKDLKSLSSKFKQEYDKYRSLVREKYVTDDNVEVWLVKKRDANYTWHDMTESLLELMPQKPQ